MIDDIGFIAPEILTVYQLAEEDINNDSDILPSIPFELEIHHVFGAAQAVRAVLDINLDNNSTFAIGGHLETNVDQIGITGGIYGIAFHSPVVATENLSDKSLFPYFSRTCTAGSPHVSAMLETLSYFSERSGPGWTDLAIVTISSLYGINFSQLFIELLPDGFQIVAFQQFINDYYTEPNFDVELREVKRSGARVIAFFGFLSTFSPFIFAADDYGLVGDDYVYISTEGLACDELTEVGEEFQQLARGMLGTCQNLDDYGFYATNDFTRRWQELDPEVYPGAGPGTYPAGFHYLIYDSVWTAAYAVDRLHKQGLLDVEGISPAIWQETILNVTFTGLSGNVTFNENGDRNSDLTVRYYDPNAGAFVKFASWTGEGTLDVISDVVWHSNTTIIPDLDIRAPFDYWSCHDREMKDDPTGKSVTLHSPDRSDVDDIDSEYHCDHFIDCQNLSDESTDCSQSYVTLYIVFGIVTSVLISLSVCILVFVVVFGLILKYQVLRVSSPVFLVVLLLSIIVGYSSVFAWFGKPHPVACALQPWLLGLPAISSIAALCAKTFRVWKIFGSEFKRQKITDLKLLGLWFLVVIPAVFIVALWMIISTPTAKMEERDGKDHYVCSTGGFTGYPGGYIFFSIFVSYAALIVFIGALLSILARKVPSMFNETKLLAISIYNLGLLGAVIIPVFLVVNPFNPFVAWILRTIAILYAFTSILVMQFAPPIIRIIFLNKFKNVDIKFMTSSSNSTPNGSDAPFSPRG